MDLAESAPAGPATAAHARGGIALFRVGGILVRLDYSWFFIFLLLLWSLAAGYLPAAHPNQPAGFYWLAGLVAALLFFGSILLHELAHAFAARRYGIETPEITLFLFGGVSQMRAEPARPAAELVIAIAGPLTSVLLALLFWAIGTGLPDDSAPMLAVVCRYLTWVNAALAVFNLLPGYPLDGGRVLRALLWYRTGSLRRATRTAANVGKGLAGAIMVLGGVQIFMGNLIGGLWLLFIGMFLRGMAARGYENVVMRQALDDAVVEQVMRREPVSVSPSLSLRQLADDYFLVYGFRSFPVVEDDTVLGLIAIEDMRHVPRTEWSAVRVADRMRRVGPDTTVAPDTPLTDALRKLSASGPGRLLVMRDGRLVGLLSKEGLARFVEIRHVLESA